MKAEVFNRFYFGERSSREFGLTIENKSILDGAEPDMTGYNIPGRAGVQYIFNERWENVEAVYSCFYRDRTGLGPQMNAGKIKNWLLGRPGVYQRLEDSYDLDHYRRAVYSGGLPISEAAGDFARLDISFSCDPFRYLKAGEQPAVLQAGKWTRIDPYDGEQTVYDTLDIYNSYGYDALPVIRFPANTKQWLGTKTRFFMVTEDRLDSMQEVELYLPGNTGDRWQVELNSPEQQATATKDGKTELLDVDWFPILRPGKNSILIVDNMDMSGTAVIPNWREL